MEPSSRAAALVSHMESVGFQVCMSAGGGGTQFHPLGRTVDECIAESDLRRRKAESRMETGGGPHFAHADCRAFLSRAVDGVGNQPEEPEVCGRGGENAKITWILRGGGPP